MDVKDCFCCTIEDAKSWGIRTLNERCGAPENDEVHSVLVGVIVLLQSCFHHSSEVIQTSHLLVQLGLLMGGRERTEG